MNDTNEIIALVVAFFTMLFKESIFKAIKNSKVYQKHEIKKLINNTDLHELRTLFGSYAIILLHNGGGAFNKSFKKATTLFHNNAPMFVFNNEIIVKNDLLYKIIYEGLDLENNTYISICDNIILVVNKDVNLEVLKNTKIYTLIDRLCKTQ